MTLSTSSRRTRRRAACGIVLLLAGCHDLPLAPDPSHTMAPPGAAVADLTESPSSASANLTIAGVDPQPGEQVLLGVYPYPTIVSMDVHQSIQLTSSDPSGGTTTMGLAGRTVGDGGCSELGEAYLLQYPPDGGFGFPFRGCDLPDRTATSYSAILPVQGTLYYGWTGDRSCPPPGEGCSSYAGSSGVVLQRLPASLDFWVDPDPATLGAIPAGTAFTFRGRPSPSHLGGYDTPMSMGGGWLFTNAAGETSELGCEYVVTPGERVCTWYFYESGSMSLRAIVNGVQLTGGPIAVTVVQPKLELALSKERARVGDTVIVTTTVTPAGGREDAQRFLFRIDPRDDGGGGGGGVPTGTRGGMAATPSVTRAAPRVRSQDAAPEPIPDCQAEDPFPKRCYIVMYRDGIAAVSVSMEYNRLPLSARKTIEVDAGPSIRITRADGPNGDEHSFTTKAGEDTVALVAEVTPASAAGTVKWKVTPNAAGRYTPRTPLPPADGAVSRFVVPHIVPVTSRADTARWPRNHQESLDLTVKAMSYTVVASVTVGGTTVSSAPVIVKQDEIDVLRQEYIDWRKEHVLTRDEITGRGDPRLNSGDYTRWPTNALIEERLPIMQALAVAKFERPLTISGGFRNPVHHHYHLGAGAHVPESRHLYAGAVDFRIFDPPIIRIQGEPPRRLTPREYFYAIRPLAHNSAVEGCFEPARVITNDGRRALDHAHVDWGRPCPEEW